MIGDCGRYNQRSRTTCLTARALRRPTVAFPSCSLRKPAAATPEWQSLGFNRDHTTRVSVAVDRESLVISIMKWTFSVSGLSANTKRVQKWPAQMQGKTCCGRGVQTRKGLKIVIVTSPESYICYYPRHGNCHGRLFQITRKWSGKELKPEKAIKIVVRQVQKARVINIQGGTAIFIAGCSKISGSGHPEVGQSGRSSYTFRNVLI